MDDAIKRTDTNDLRVNLTKYLTENIGDTIYITRYNKLVGEIRVYTKEIMRKTELRIARKMVEEAESEKKEAS
jgi:4-hydroxy-3-methylbut-2-en-1-yl diphosphate synthase IspG/GcpE